MKIKHTLQLSILLTIICISIVITACGSKNKKAKNTIIETKKDEIISTLPQENHTHIWSEWITKNAPTCTEKGLKYRFCACGNQEEIHLASLGHNLSEWSISIIPQCEIEGLEERSCINCDYKETQSIDALIHTKGKWIIINNAKHVLCIYCGKSITIEMLVFSENLKIENGALVSIGKCKDLDIVVPDISSDIPITTVAKYAFEYENILSIILPDTVLTIKENAFNKCLKLENIHLGNNLTTIEKKAFYNCSSLEILYLPESLTTLGEYAFAYCSSLKTVYIGNSISKLEMRVFQDCKNLKDFFFNGTIEEWNNIEKDVEWDLGTSDYIVHCIDGDISK